MELIHKDQNQDLSEENGKNGNISKKWNDLAEVSSNTLAQKQNLTLATKILKDFAPNLCAKFANEALERCFSAKTYTLTQLRLNCAGLQNSWLSAQITYLNSISGATQNDGDANGDVGKQYFTNLRLSENNRTNGFLLPVGWRKIRKVLRRSGPDADND